MAADEPAHPLDPDEWEKMSDAIRRAILRFLPGRGWEPQTGLAATIQRVASHAAEARAFAIKDANNANAGLSNAVNQLCVGMASGQVTAYNRVIHDLYYALLQAGLIQKDGSDTCCYTLPDGRCVSPSRCIHSAWDDETRWLQEAEHIVAIALEDVQPPESDLTQPDPAFYEDARRILRALDDAYLLVRPGGQHRVDYAAFKTEHVPPALSEGAVLRSSAETALHTARLFGPKGWAGKRHAIWWPDGGEYLGAWERLDVTPPPV